MQQTFDLQSHFDLLSPGGRRDAILATIGDKAMSLVDICQELRLDGQAERARMRTALDHLERKNIVEIATHPDGRPLASNKSIVFRVSGRGPAREANRAHAVPRPEAGYVAYARPAPTVTASMRRGSALATLQTKVVPGMTGWETVAQIALRTRLRPSVVRTSVSAGLHDNPPILYGWTPCGCHRTQRLGNRTVYLPSALVDVVPEPEPTAKPGPDPRVDVLASGSSRWESIVEIARRTGMAKSDVTEALRLDSRSPQPTFASSSRTNGAGVGRPFRTASRFLLASLVGAVAPERPRKVAKPKAKPGKRVRARAKRPRRGKR